MDLLYSRYADPKELMNIYIRQGRFGEFVAGICEMDMKRKKEVIQKDEENRLWLAYIHSMTDKSFRDWKEELMKIKESADYDMTNAQVNAVKQQVRGILDRITPV
ncbi:MAG: hypothetical protein HDQ96_04795 [Lachnospiraceae bacterium]|nr:hypothetical protein [Lachnospiraceae bacterium]